MYAFAELCYVAGKRQELKNPALALDRYGTAVTHAYLYLFDERYGPARNPYDPQFRGSCDLYNSALESALRHRALRMLGPARCLYGSDGPYGYRGADGGYDHGAILRQIKRAELPAPDLDRVLGGNFRALVPVLQRGESDGLL